MFVILPHLEDRELGEPNIDEEGAPVIWDHPLPFFGQAVTDLGFELPLPFGISVIPATFEQDLTLRDLSLGLQGEADRPIDAVEFRNPSVRNSALQVKFDAWLFALTVARPSHFPYWAVSCCLSSATGPLQHLQCVTESLRAQPSPATTGPTGRWGRLWRWAGSSSSSYYPSSTPSAISIFWTRTSML